MVPEMDWPEDPLPVDVELVPMKRRRHTAAAAKTYEPSVLAALDVQAQVTANGPTYQGRSIKSGVK